MMVWKKTNMDKQKGFTLVEVLASIVLISLIVMVSISFFIHSQRTQNTSSQITDATYVVQNEMEFIENLSNTESFTVARLRLVNDFNYHEQSDSHHTFRFERTESPFLIKLRVITDKSLTSYEEGEMCMCTIIVEALEDSKLKSKMETKKEWRVDGE